MKYQVMVKKMRKSEASAMKTEKKEGIREEEK